MKFIGKNGISCRLNGNSIIKEVKMKKGIIKEHIIKCRTTVAGHDSLRQLIEELLKDKIHRPAYHDIEYYQKPLADKSGYNTGLYSKGDKNVGLRIEGDR